MINAYVWQKYGKQQEKEEAAEAVLQYLPLVRYHASRLALGLPAHIAEEDLVQAGVLGLLEAYNRATAARRAFEICRAAYSRRHADGCAVCPGCPVRCLNKCALDQAVQKLTSSLGREPEEQELADGWVFPAETAKLLRISTAVL